jgi:hypothetical protein
MLFLQGSLLVPLLLSEPKSDRVQRWIGRR